MLKALKSLIMRKIHQMKICLKMMELYQLVKDRPNIVNNKLNQSIIKTKKN